MMPYTVTLLCAQAGPEMAPMAAQANKNFFIIFFSFRMLQVSRG
jgi:hypothetical protein